MTRIRFPSLVDTKIWGSLSIVVLLFLLVACQDDGTPTPTAVAQTSQTATSEISAPTTEPTATNTATAEPTATPTNTPTPLPPTPTPIPPKTVTVCMPNEPTDLYLYGDSSLAATAVRHAIYESLYTTLDYQYQPQALTAMPSLDTLSASIRPVDVQQGEWIINAAGSLVRLLPGTQIVNADGEIIIYRPPAEDAPPVQMQQMRVEFAFQPLVWSDGTAVTAADSVYSFNIAADADTPSNKSKIERTAVYQAVNDQTVRWVGLPGFIDDTYFTNVWSPLPQHQLEGLTAVDLLTAAETARTPLSYGPFVVTDWQPGVAIQLMRNPHYFRPQESINPIEQLTIRFDADLTDPATAVLAGDCDLVTHDAITLEDIPAIQAVDGLQPYFTPNTIYEHLDFGINSWNYGDDLHNGRPDWFDFIAVRQAVAQCIDRDRLNSELLFGQGSVIDAYVPVEHPLFPEDATRWSYDPEAANGLLEGFGLLDTDGDGYREWIERNLQQTIVATTTFSITLGTDSESPLRLRLNELIQDDLADCGIQVNLYDVPAEVWYDDGPFSPLFGRRFDLATFAWRTSIRPSCGLYLSTNITGPEELGFGGWGNLNATGWGNEAYDLACQAALTALPGNEAYQSNHQEAIRLFTDRVPSLPLIQYVKTAVANPTLLNIKPNPTQSSELWNLFEWDLEE